MPRIRTPDLPPGPLADFFAALQRTHLQAGEPSTREIARLSNSLSHDTVHRLLSSTSLPRWRNVEAVVVALNGDVDQIRTLWLAVRVAEEGAPALRSRETAVPTPEVHSAAPNPGPGTARILVVDDHPVFRFGLAQVLLRLGYEVREAGDGEDSLREAAEFRPHLVLMDINMPGMSGIEATALLRRRDEDCRVVMLTMSADTESVRQSLRAGASGYLLKGTSLEALHADITRALAGEPVFTPGLANAVLAEYEEVTPLEDELRLTAREKDVLRLMSGGMSNSGIARQLNVSPKTVANILANVYAKYGVTNRASAAALAVHRGVAGDEFDQHARLTDELRMLTRGRGVQAPGAGEHAGPLIRALSGITALDGREVAQHKVRTWVLTTANRLPESQRIAVTAVLGLHEDAQFRFLNERIEWLAKRTERGTRTVRRVMDASFAHLAEKALSPE